MNYESSPRELNNQQQQGTNSAQECVIRRNIVEVICDQRDSVPDKFDLVTRMKKILEISSIYVTIVKYNLQPTIPYVVIK